MSSILDIFFTLRGVTAVFRLGFVPRDGDLYELTPEQYERYYATIAKAEKHLNETVYMVLPEDHQKYIELASEEVFTLTEEEVIFTRQAEQLIEMYCTESKKKFNSFEEKLHYCASVMPSVISKGTKYECLERKF